MLMKNMLRFISYFKFKSQVTCRTNSSQNKFGHFWSELCSAANLNSCVKYVAKLLVVLHLINVLFLYLDRLLSFVLKKMRKKFKSSKYSNFLF